MGSLSCSPSSQAEASGAGRRLGCFTVAMSEEGKGRATAPMQSNEKGYERTLPTLVLGPLAICRQRGKPERISFSGVGEDSRVRCPLLGSQAGSHIEACLRGRLSERASAVVLIP